jgi:hypothetical protein
MIKLPIRGHIKGAGALRNEWAGGPSLERKEC